MATVKDLIQNYYITKTEYQNAHNAFFEAENNLKTTLQEIDLGVVFDNNIYTVKDGVISITPMKDNSTSDITPKKPSFQQVNVRKPSGVEQKSNVEVLEKEEPKKDEYKELDPLTDIPQEELDKLDKDDVEENDFPPIPEDEEMDSDLSKNHKSGSRSSDFLHLNKNASQQTSSSGQSIKSKMEAAGRTLAEKHTVLEDIFRPKRH